jgi:type I protein arginine methyltransferase
MSNETYSLSGYGCMIADRIRIEAFKQALQGAIHPGAVVMDIGTGPGILAVLACQLGASRVYAIEGSDVIQVGQEIAAANHCADKIVFFEDISTKVTIPELVDVIVSDLRGVLPLFGAHIPSIVDARRRFLRPGGTLIPRKDKIWAAIVEAPETYGRFTNPWARNILGQDLKAGLQKILNSFRNASVKPEQLLTVPQLWTTLDYYTVENPDVRNTLHWSVQRDGVGHGIFVWFDMELADSVSFSNAPGKPETIYGGAFFPWLEPVPLMKGQNICVEMQAKLLESDYFWNWATRIESAEKAGETIKCFEQSQLQGAVLSLTKLRKSGSDYVPQLSEEGLMRRRALELMDGNTPLETIARKLTSEFPKRFERWQQALTFASSVSSENSR